MSATDSGLPLIAHRYVPPGNNPFEALHNLITFSSKDFGADRTDAWLYGIVVGWDNEDTDPDPEDLGAMDELAATFGWDAQTVAQLRELRSQWIQRTATPVVPAPVETESWPTLEQVPDLVEFRGTFSDGGSRTETVWIKRDGVLWHSRPGRTHRETVRIGHLTPFVAAKAGQ